MLPDADAEKENPSPALAQKTHHTQAKATPNPTEQQPN